MNVLHTILPRELADTYPNGLALLHALIEVEIARILDDPEGPEIGEVLEFVPTLATALARDLGAYEREVKVAYEPSPDDGDWPQPDAGFIRSTWGERASDVWVKPDLSALQFIGVSGKYTFTCVNEPPRVGEEWRIPRDGDTPAEVAVVTGTGVGDDGHGNSQPIVVVLGPAGERELPVDWLVEFGRRK